MARNALPLDTLTVRELRNDGDLRDLILHWQGDENVTVTDALALIAAAREQHLANDRENARLQDEIRSWLAGRDQAWRDAGRAAADKARSKGKGSPEVHYEAQRAGLAAAEDYERTVDRPSSGGVPCIPFTYIKDDEATGLLGRVRRAVTGDKPAEPRDEVAL